MAAPRRPPMAPPTIAPRTALCASASASGSIIANPSKNRETTVQRISHSLGARMARLLCYAPPVILIPFPVQTQYLDRRSHHVAIFRYRLSCRNLTARGHFPPVLLRAFGNPGLGAAFKQTFHRVSIDRPLGRIDRLSQGPYVSGPDPLRRAVVVNISLSLRCYERWLGR